MESQTTLPDAPKSLAASAQPGGTIRLEFSGGEAGLQYEIWRRHGDSGEWGLHATTGEGLFEDSPVDSGQYYEYKVRAVAGGSESEFSPSAVAYGTA